MSNIHTSINPYTGATIKEYAHQTKRQIESLLKNANESHRSWKYKSLKHKRDLLNELANNLSNKKQHYAELITAEIGKPISESLSEIEKCIDLCHFYRVNAQEFLADALIETEASESFISHDSLGCILGIMPWNYPFWQALRFSIPTITAGNVVLLKHASNVTGCALAIQDLFDSSGYLKDTYQTLVVGHEHIEHIISSDIVKAVSLTGSEGAGRKIGEIAGRNLKKMVLELGGTNACIVLEDANIEKYIDTMVSARYQNNGQSCIAAKRFIVVDSIYDTFLEAFTNRVAALKTGDPMNEDTEISVLAKEAYSTTIAKQVKKSIDLGAKVHYGNTNKGAFYEPTILTDVTENMPAFKEEVFGPVSAIIKVKDNDSAFRVNANTNYGLGTMLFTENIDNARRSITDINDGAFFINAMVKSDVRLPFGGTKNSGYGRELSKEGILEFTNKKTVYIK